MTNELEKRFFDTFGIKPKPIYSGSKLYNPFVTGYDYPTITDRILLKLICIANEQDTYPSTTNINNIKARTLKMLLGAIKFSAIYTESPNRRRLFVKRVRTLFKEV